MAELVCYLAIPSTVDAIPKVRQVEIFPEAVVQVLIYHVAAVHVIAVDAVALV